jgi:SAM-dependent methyltransferase
MIIKKCRNCQSRELSKLFSLGSLSFTGKFANNKKINIPKAKIILMICNNCKLVQLDRNFNPKYLYGKDYGYRTGINSTMTNHVKNIVKNLSQLVDLKNNSAVLDIGSNDGTLLNFYSKNVTRVGIDPTIKKYRKFYKQINIAIPSFFNSGEIKRKIKKKFKIITALSMFYDLENPNKFLSEIHDLLDPEGIFCIEHADLYSIIKNNVFDTMCHEHLEYYSSTVLIQMCKNNNLRIFKHQFNDTNGGSSRYLICHENSKYPHNKNYLEKLISLEKKLGLNKKTTFKKFFKKINNIKLKTQTIIKKIIKQKKIIYGYGASTKGNVILQYFNIGKYIDYIADRNPLKFNKFTPGTKIKIISEEMARKNNPDFYFVLPWHFKTEILKREKFAIKNGSKFIFALPKLNIN